MFGGTCRTRPKRRLKRGGNAPWMLRVVVSSILDEFDGFSEGLGANESTSRSSSCGSPSGNAEVADDSSPGAAMRRAWTTFELIAGLPYALISYRWGRGARGRARKLCSRTFAEPPSVSPELLAATFRCRL